MLKTDAPSNATTLFFLQNKELQKCRNNLQPEYKEISPLRIKVSEEKFREMYDNFYNKISQQNCCRKK